ncbi:hypothetical protein HDV64DRAFT_222974 [Trichoderma sp. TUCIM 5745]
MALPASKSQMPDFGDIHHATTGCISDFKACLSIKPLMKEGWAESRLADLNLWASGVGALARPDTSLDQRLQFHPKPRMVLINLLLTLREFISSCRMCALNEVHGNRGSTDSKAESEGAPVSPAESIAEPTLGDDSDLAPSSTSWFTALASGAKSASDSSTESDIEDNLDDPHSEVTLKEVMKDVDDILDQLILLGFAIRKSGTVARLRRADSSFKPSENKDLQEHLEFILLNSVARRQKNMKDDVGSTTRGRIQEVTPEQRHLILANLRRRHRFQYARRHQQKLDQLTTYTPVAKAKIFAQTPEEHQEITPRLNKSPASNDGKSPPTEDFPSTPSAAMPQNLQVPEMSATTPSVAEGDILQMAMPTAAAASRVSVSVATMHYPSPPPVSQKMRGFKCPCCYQTLPEMYKNWSRWRKHLVEDLCPYTCPFPECPRPEVLYISRAAWRDHVLQSHGAGQIWECLACVGTGESNKFSSAQEFVSHNETNHADAISEDQIAVLQDTCRKIVPPNIAQCPLCPWPQDEEAVPDAVANLEHVGNCIHEFSLYALPWAESMAVDATDQSNPALREKVEEWLKSTCTEEEESADIDKVNIETFIFFPTQPLPTKQDCAHIPEEYFAESSNESSQAERGTLSLDSDLPEARGTYSDDISDKASEEGGWPHKAFKRAMERIEENPDPAIQSLAKRTLIWIIHAKRPLSVTEIRHALTVREHMTKFDSNHMPHLEDLKSACVGLVTTDEESGNIQLVNQLFQKFFQQLPKKWFPEGESYITKICLTYLSFSTFGGALCKTDEHLRDRLKENPFYGYAACNWGHHARESSIASQEIMNFLESTMNMEASSQVLFADRPKEHFVRLYYSPRDSTHMTGLHLAAYFGIERVVDVILSSRNNPPDLKDILGRTPLLWAAENGHLPVVEQLIATGQVEIDSGDIQGRTPLSWAAENGHVPVVEQLIATGQVEIDSKDTIGMRPLIWAAKKGHAAVARLLLDKGARPNSQTYDHRTPLSYASENGKVMCDHHYRMRQRRATWRSLSYCLKQALGLVLNLQIWRGGHHSCGQ